MKFELLKQRVIRVERLVEGRLERTQSHATSLKTTWRESWTPTRILLAGLIGGFLVGRARPGRVVRRLGGLNGARWIQLITTASGLLASLQSALAAVTAKKATEQAADVASDAAAQTGPGAGPTAGGSATASTADDPAATAEAEAMPPSDRRRRPDPTWSAPPRPAEAATEISER